MDKFPSRERAAATEVQQRVTAVVVTRETGRSLELCLRGALAEPVIDELIIVDAGNAPEVSSALRALQADRRDVKVIAPGRVVSFAEGANLGAAAARGRWLLFLDAHVVVQRGAVARMAAAGGGARRPWIVGGKLTDTNGRDRRSARGGALNVWSTIALAMALPARRVAPKRRLQTDEPASAAAVSGAFMLIPREDFHTLGGFDDGYLTDGADLDLCRRAGNAGGAILFEPNASGVQFMGPKHQPSKLAQGLARFAAKSARNPVEHAFALVAAPALGLMVSLREFIAGRPPERR